MIAILVYSKQDLQQSAKDKAKITKESTINKQRQKLVKNLINCY